MSIDLVCYGCGQELDEPGAVLLGLPARPINPVNTHEPGFPAQVFKYHLCVYCWAKTANFLRLRRVSGAWPTPTKPPSTRETPDPLRSVVDATVALAALGGTTDGEHHKQWALDQIIRLLTGDEYAAYGNDPDWDQGTPP